MPITRLLYPECGGNTLDSHKAFTVHYKIGEDLDLSYHYDNAEVTLNVSLGKEFVGGELFFGDMRQVIYCIIDAKISNFQDCHTFNAFWVFLAMKLNCVTLVTLKNYL